MFPAEPSTDEVILQKIDTADPSAGKISLPRIKAFNVGLSLFFIVALLGCREQRQPTFQFNFKLADLGLQLFDLKVPETKRRTILTEYLEHPLMAIAFERYSNSRRPPNNRVTKKIYEEFVYKIWVKEYQAIEHPRMKYVRDAYRWGTTHIPEIAADIALVRMKIDLWVKDAVSKIPFNTKAMLAGDKPMILVFLFDPGGSYPWVDETITARYIYFDVLQLRGFTDEERALPINENLFRGFIAHELFHQFQNDQFEIKDKADWLIKTAVDEGSAMLLGNNAFDVKNIRFRANEPVMLAGKALSEWEQQMPKVCGRIKSLLELHSKWKHTPPSEEEYFKIISQQGWVATPENGYLFGDLYRVGTQMLLDIKRDSGVDEFYEVVGYSGKLIESWKRSSSCGSL